MLATIGTPRGGTDGTQDEDKKDKYADDSVKTGEHSPPFANALLIVDPKLLCFEHRLANHIIYTIGF
jgi:hypothetical protein